MPPPPAAKPDELAKRFGLEPLSESVLRLTQLVARRDAVAEEVAKIISQDKSLAARLLRTANPKAESQADYSVTTVEEGLARIGMNWVLLLAMSDPVMRAVHNTFATMFAIELKPLTVNSMIPFEGEHVLGEVGFSGKATGVVHLRLVPAAATLVAARLLGVKPEELGSPAEVDDVIGELSNIVAGNFKSNLCDASLECKLSPPKITRTSDFKIHKPSGNVAERAGFRAPELDLFVDISVNPWNE